MLLYKRTSFSDSQDVPARLVEFDVGDDDEDALVPARTNAPVTFGVGRIFARKVWRLDYAEAVLHVERALASW